MTTDLLSRFVAAIVLAFLFGLVLHQFNHAKLARLETTNAQEIVDHEKTLADHGYAHEVILMAMFGSMYMFLIETVAFVLRRGWRPSAVE
jgi:hypothetical protein